MSTGVSQTQPMPRSINDAPDDRAATAGLKQEVDQGEFNPSFTVSSILIPLHQ